MNIKILDLEIVNFKGTRYQHITFNEDSTNISGENGVGKTTIFDAFCWLLFGKDSLGRSDSNFNIKTLDPETGKPILKLDHYVQATMKFGEKTATLKRKFVENWVKPRGTIEETLANHKTEFFWNDVKLGTKKEYDAKIAEYIPEDTFRMLTNPFYFVSLKPEAQKEMLLEMAGGVSDEDVATQSQDFQDLIAALSGTPLITFLKELSAKKKACKREIDTLPDKISLTQTLLPKVEDWGILQNEIFDKEAELKGIEDILMNSNKSTQAILDKNKAMQAKLNELATNIEKARADVLVKVQREAGHLHNTMTQVKNSISANEATITSSSRDIGQANQSIFLYEEKLTELRELYVVNANRKFSMPSDDIFVCPTCLRPLEPHEIAEKKQSMLEEFNKTKADYLEKNNNEGRRIKAEKEHLEAEKVKLEARIKQAEEENAKYAKQISELQENPLISNLQAHIDQSLENDLTYRTLSKEYDTLKEEASKEPLIPIDDELTSKKVTLRTELDLLKARYANKEQYERMQNEINAMNKSYNVNNEKLAELERMEYVALQFQKAKDDLLHEKINKLFKYVTFSFISTQLNGGEKLTCICNVNGTPYQDINSAAKINAGIDIINAISQHVDTFAPVFIDNRETVNTLIPCKSQIISLTVTKDKEITIQ